MLCIYNDYFVFWFTQMIGNLVKHCNPLTLDHYDSNKSSHVASASTPTRCLDKYIHKMMHG